jgi:Mrp family chromosome partitioning ATPase
MTIQDKKDFAIINFEECRSLRKIITRQGRGIVSITSLEQDEVVGDLAIEIAKALSQQHFHVLLVDANHMNPGLYDWFALKNSEAVIEKFPEINDVNLARRVTVRIDTECSFDLLPCESNLEQREYFSSVEFKDNIIGLKANYEYIILSLPALKNNYETQELMSISDQTYAVVEMMEDEFKDVSAAIQSLQLSGNSINGWIAVNRKSKKYPYFEKLFKYGSK